MKTHCATDNMKSPSNGRLDGENFVVNDVGKFLETIYFLARQKGFLIQKLGTVGEDPILLLKPRDIADKPHILIAGGFHGEEPAGCWGIVRFLQGMPDDLLSQINISFLPLINPAGLRYNRRENDYGENPNSGFCHNENSQSQL